MTVQFLLFFFDATATPEIYTLSLHDALPISRRRSREVRRAAARTGLAARRRTVGRRLEVVWERVDGGEARGLSAGWHTVVAAPGPATAAGALEEVVVEAVEGEVLRATLRDP